MRILYLTSCPPWPATCGGQIRSGGVARALARCGHRVRVLCPAKKTQMGTSAHGEEIELVRVVREPGRVWDWTAFLRDGDAPISTGFRTHDFLRRVAAELREADLFVVDGLDLYACIPRNARAAAWVDLVDEVGERYLQRSRRARSAVRKLVLAFHAWSLRRSERLVCSKARRLFVCSESDRERLGGFADVSRVDVLPTVMSGRLCDVSSRKAPGCEILFVGALSYEPNETGLRLFCERIFPRIVEAEGRARLVVVGQGPAPPWLRSLAAMNAAVELHLDAPDLRRFYERASVCVMPMVTGTGLPTKILEGLAAGRNIVAFVPAVKGLVAELHPFVTVVESIEDMASAVLDAFDAWPGEAQIEECRSLLERRYSVDAVAKILESRLTNVTEHLGSGDGKGAV